MYIYTYKYILLPSLNPTDTDFGLKKTNVRKTHPNNKDLLLNLLVTFNFLE